MPGVLHHLYFAEEVVKDLDKFQSRASGLHDKIKLDRDTFYLANLMPDLAKDKESRHFKEDSKVAKGFKTPNLKKASKSFLKIENPSIQAGIFGHLYLDRCFINYFIYPQFDFNWQEDKITSYETSKTYTVAEFFSRDGLYRGYSEMNHIIIDNHLIDMEHVNSLPDWPPQTGIKKYDTWRKESWREELDRYLSHLADTSDMMFLAEDFTGFISLAAKKFCIANLYRYFC